MKGRRKIKGSIEKFCTDLHLINQTIQNVVSLKPNALLKQSGELSGNKHMHTRKYTHVYVQEVAQHSWRTQNERMRLFQLNSPVTNQEPVSL